MSNRNQIYTKKCKNTSFHSEDETFIASRTNREFCSDECKVYDNNRKAKVFRDLSKEHLIKIKHNYKKFDMFLDQGLNFMPEAEIKNYKIDFEYLGRKIKRDGIVKNQIFDIIIEIDNINKGLKITKAINYGE